VIGIGYQDAHLCRARWPVVGSIARKGSWATVQNPGTRAGHAGVFWRYGVEEEVYVDTRQGLGEARGLVVDDVDSVLNGDAGDL